ncbi:MAG TPA: LysR substrate-binding domain-containing protein [Telluria sp.]|nr:LysR substrate-binding domain-containing protein [Telluria sp.]
MGIPGLRRAAGRHAATDLARQNPRRTPLLQAAIGGCGVAVLPRYAAEVAPPELLRLDDPPCPVRRKLWLVMHEDVRRTPAVRAVADALIGLI